MHRARLAATLATTLLLVGCTDDPEPKVEPSETPSSTSSDPTSEPPEVLGPEATVRAWVKARNRALLDGDVSEIAALSDASCKSCRDLYEPIQNVYELGGSIQTQGWSLVSIRVKSRSKTVAVVTAAVRYAAGQTIPEAGSDPVPFETENHLMTFDLAQASGTWRVSLVGYIS